jgi:quercetin dioxygenase-like cupin family protein
LKLLGRETDESIMMFEETLPSGTASLYHLHCDSDEVAWVLAGEFTFKIGDKVAAAGGLGTCVFMPRDVPHAWKNTGSETGRALFLYTRRRRPYRALSLPPYQRRRSQQTLRTTAGKLSPQLALRGFSRGGERRSVRRIGYWLRLLAHGTTTCLFTQDDATVNEPGASAEIVARHGGRSDLSNSSSNSR